MPQDPIPADELRKPVNDSAPQAAPHDPPRAMEEPRHLDAPHIRAVTPEPEGKKADHMAEREACAEDRQEALLDEALEETFPGSDPISPKHIT